MISCFPERDTEGDFIVFVGGFSELGRASSAKDGPGPSM